MTPEQQQAADRLAIAACDFAMDQIARGRIIERVRGYVEPGITEHESSLRHAAVCFAVALRPETELEASRGAGGGRVGEPESNVRGDDLRIAVDGGKYTFSRPEAGYKIHVLRHGQPWVVIGDGSNAVSALMNALVEANREIDVGRREIAKLKTQVPPEHVPIPKKADPFRKGVFVMCRACVARRGAAELCPSCYANRTLLERAHAEIDRLKELFRRYGHAFKVRRVDDAEMGHGWPALRLVIRHMIQEGGRYDGETDPCPECGDPPPKPEHAERGWCEPCQEPVCCDEVHGPGKPAR